MTTIAKVFDDIKNKIIALTLAITEGGFIDDSLIGSPDGIAPLDSTGKVPTTHIPGYHKVTISTEDPSGGTDGDIWYKVES